MPGPFSVPALSAPAGVGPTRTQYRRAVGRAVGRLRWFTVTEAPDAANPDAAREVIVEAMGSDGQDAGRLDRSFLYAVDGADKGETRAVWAQSYDGARGSILVDRPYSTAPAVGTEVELSSPLGGGEWLDTKGLNDFVQEALDRIVVEVRLPMTGTGSRSVAVGLTYPWLASADAVLGVADSRNLTSGSPTQDSIYPAEVRRDGVAATLVTGETYRAGEAFEVVAAVPANRLVFDGSSWAYVTPTAAAPYTLAQEHYQGAAPLEWVTAFGAAKALEWLIAETEADELLDDKVRSRRLDAYARRYDKYVTAAASIKLQHFPRPSGSPEREIVGVTGYRRWVR